MTSDGPSTGTLARPAEPLSDALAAWGPPVAFGLRMWASVCLALYVVFWLELDNPFWAGTTAAIVCQPQLGASLRKGWFRMIGTLIGATMAVVLTACFPQDRITFLVLLAFWCAFCAFVATVLRNFASYSAALAGYTAAIIAADTLGATGAQAQTFSYRRSGVPAISASDRVRRCGPHRDRSRRCPAATRGFLSPTIKGLLPSIPSSPRYAFPSASQFASMSTMYLRASSLRRA